MPANDSRLLTANLTPRSAHTFSLSHYLHTRILLLLSRPSVPSTRARLLALACGLAIVALHCMGRQLSIPPSTSPPSALKHKYTTSQRAFNASLSFLSSKPVNRKSCFLVIPFFYSSFLFPRAWCSLSIPSHSNNPIPRNQHHYLSPVDFSRKSTKINITLLINSSCPPKLQ